jgi:hypothetical protein
MAVDAQQAPEDRPFAACSLPSSVYYRYAYTRLREARNIRLLHLAPHPDQLSNLRGCLKEYCQSDVPRYESLSYVWGSDDKTANIFIDEEGAAIPITQSLYSALLNVRDASEERVIWIDQICIDQCNVRERNEQVQQMGSIYENAERDIVWLGNGNRSECAAVDWLTAVMKAWEAFILSNPSGRWNKAATVALESQNAEVDAHWHKLDHIFRLNPIWNRVWIVQEILLADKIVLQHSNSKIDFDLFHRFFEAAHIANHQPRFLILQTHLEQLWYNRNRQKTDQRSLEGLLFDYWDLEATDPRDKIYALLGIARKIDLTVDYSKSMTQLQFDTAKAMMTQSRTLNLLCFDRCNLPSSDVEQRTPSWVFDYRGLIASDLWTLANSDFTGRGALGGFFAGGLDPPETLPFRFVGERLEAAGRFVDTIEDIQAAFHVPEDRNQMAEPSMPHAWHMTLCEEVTRMVHKASEAAGRSPRESDWVDVSRLLVHDQIVTEDRLDEEQIFDGSAEFRSWTDAVATDRLEDYLSTQHNNRSDFAYSLEDIWSTGTRLLAMTAKHKLLVTVSSDAKPGDELCVLRAASVPLLLRKSYNRPYMETYKHVGTAYVSGIMDGEAWDQTYRFPSKLYQMI